MQYGAMTQCLRPLFQGDAEAESDAERDALRGLIQQEGEGRPISIKSLPEDAVFVRMKTPITLFFVLGRPVAESLRIVEKIRSMLSLRLPVVIIAPPNSAEFKRQMLEQGVYTYLERPVQPGQIEKLIEEIRVNAEERIP